MLSHHTTNKTSAPVAARHTAEEETLAFLKGLHALLEQQLREIEVVAATFDYRKFGGFTGMLSGSSPSNAH
jgi:hypothetical protein